VLRRMDGGEGGEGRRVVGLLFFLSFSPSSFSRLPKDEGTSEH